MSEGNMQLRDHENLLLTCLKGCCVLLDPNFGLSGQLIQRLLWARKILSLNYLDWKTQKPIIRSTGNCSAFKPTQHLTSSCHLVSPHLPPDLHISHPGHSSRCLLELWPHPHSPSPSLHSARSRTVTLKSQRVPPLLPAFRCGSA